MREDDEALAAQLLQRLAHRVGAGAIAGGERRDLQPLVGGEAAAEDIFADQVVDAARFERGEVLAFGSGVGKIIHGRGFTASHRASPSAKLRSSYIGVDS